MSDQIRRGLLFLGVLYLSFGPERCHAQEKVDDVKSLLKERRDLLSEVYTQMWTIYLKFPSNVTLQDLLQAERDSFKADLDYFDKPEDRIKALEKHKAVADSLLKIANAQVTAARQPRYVASQAKAHVLEVQIELLKEKQKAKPGK